jgi:hypothetical protein
VILHKLLKMRQQYDEGSPFGIEGGRISKLMLKQDGTLV